MTINRQALHAEHATKAEALFSLRCLRECLTAATSEASHAQFLERLLELQCSIYTLDVYGERNWAIASKDLAEIWRGIRLSWSAVPTLEGKRPPLTDIEEYQQIEVDMREGRRPDMIPIDIFYRHKTCDVRLMRQLIWSAYESPNSFVRRLWEIFDLVGEILDDVSDVDEDRLTYNGNRFAFCLRQYGAGETASQYELFVDRLSQEFHQIVLKHSELVHTVCFLEGKLTSLRADVKARLESCDHRICSSDQQK
jgi:hypothetical protein